MFKPLLILAGLVFAISAHADDGEKTVRDAIQALVPGAAPDVVQKSDIPGYYDVVLRGQILRVSADGKYLVQGDVIDMAVKAPVPSRALSSFREAALKNLALDKRLEFSPPNPKHTVVIFTDVDCPFCRQFHKQIAAYNQLGIAVQYVLFPLDSIHPNANTKAVSVWCSQDRNSAYTAAMNGQDPGKKTCANPVAETTALALKIGVNSTPTVMTPDGVQVNGTIAQDPKQLLAELDRLAAVAAASKTPVAAK